jgi:hypothetical protein
MSSTSGHRDGWFITISLAGSIERSECVGTAAIDALSDVAVTPDASIWVTGTTDAATTTGKLRRATRGRTYDRAFTARTDGPRGPIGGLRLVSNEIARGYGITADAAGNVYATGETTAVPSRTGLWTATLHPTAGAFRENQRLGSTDPYVIALGKP